MRRMLMLLLLVIAASAEARPFDFRPREFNIFLSGGTSRMNERGHSRFRTIHFEFAGTSPYVARWIPHVQVGGSVSYSDIQQARSWFGYRYGEPDDWVRGVGTFFFLRRHWREASPTQPYFEIGTGPMWSNRRVPAATARLNFNSQAGVGVVFFSRSRVPLHVGYRYSHVSSGFFHGRNPGLNVHLAVVGVRVKQMGDGR
jgi:opacity protein-like surface antigen